MMKLCLLMAVLITALTFPSLAEAEEQGSSLISYFNILLNFLWKSTAYLFTTAYNLFRAGLLHDIFDLFLKVLNGEFNLNDIYQMATKIGRILIGRSVAGDVV